MLVQTNSLGIPVGATGRGTLPGVWKDMWERRERESSEGEFERKGVRETGGTWAVGESAKERA